MNYLQAVDKAYGIAALKAQAMLLQMQNHGLRWRKKSISAMPSVHVAVAAIVAIWAWNRAAATDCSRLLHSHYPGCLQCISDGTTLLTDIFRS